VGNNTLIMKKTRTGVFSVRKVKLQANGHTYFEWKVDGRINGTRHRRFFSSREDAEAHRAEKEIQALNETKIVRTTASHLSGEQLRDAEGALQRLQGRYSLMMAADWLLRTYRDTLTRKTFAETYPLFLDERLSHLRSTTYQDYRSTLTSFASVYGHRDLPGIGTGDIIEFLKSRGVAGKSWNNLRADLNAFFAWCEKPPREWIANNPVRVVEKFEIAQGIPEILSAEKVKELFAFLETYRGNPRTPLEPGCLVPYFALAVFAGIRPSVNGGEITRIAKLVNTKRIIDLKAGVIRIPPELAKTKDVRQVMIQPCLQAWLQRYPIARYPLIPCNACHLLPQVRGKFGIGHDVLRHTFISMHVSKFRSMGDTALQAGNSEAMIKKHYLNLATPDEAEAFWQIAPALTKQAAA
jgi:hypothetical protein